jgi:hypothetical protein
MSQSAPCHGRTELHHAAPPKKPWVPKLWFVAQRAPTSAAISRAAAG